MKSGNLNFLEPSGPLQACNGTAFTCFEHKCSSSGGQNCIVQSLVSSHWKKRMV